MAIMIYNSLTRKKETFDPLDPEKRRVTFYNCGPTVYDHFHIGNARTFVMNDIIRRYLGRTYTVTFVQNLTDIDDKIINRANAEHVPFDEIRLKYIQAYFDDAAKLGIHPADQHPKATEFIPQMIDLMKRIEGAGLAYPAEGSLYFRVRKFPEYGKLSGRSVDDLREGARVEVSEEKEDPLDFVLWKAAKPGEPKWPSPWGEGRPGWHLECSTMAMAILGETIDIHAGGHDLMFPHHENEIAQSEGATHKTFARYWLHNGFLNIDHEKMSKSLGNIMKIDQVLERYPVPAVRFFLMSAHYRSPLDYNAEALAEAASAVGRINEGLDTAEKILKLLGRSVERADEAALKADPAAAPYLAKFEEAMDDDFNTPRALAVIHEVVSDLHETLRKKGSDPERLVALVKAGGLLREFFGLVPR
ncbi:cysteine--tRNA ligase, partial [Candidatus Sumerlaeota bacterium]|nr:cysteine--tRNA ligase [Candidatus Sumerlaeota bacterium]